MSGTTAGAIVAALLAFSLAAACWQIRRANNICEEERARVLEEGRISGSFAPAARAASETRPGTDLAEQDDLELLYSIPSYGLGFEVGRARLQQAINDDRTNQGDQ
ncbi:hypothetical protein ACGFY9_14140 [Streptomyces sp. NPDC048504]|uniref:hypothetical protein n=1 Tax=Streptomyces sp. NPDC048504 TaxID=3365559 RepID=UPI00371ED17A